MQKIHPRVFFAPLVPALLISLWAGYAVLSFGASIVSEQILIVFFMWAVAGELGLILFGFPMLFGIRKEAKIGLYRSIFISVSSAVFMTAIITYIIPGRVPWYVAFTNMSIINIPCGLIGGVALWVINFRNQS